MNKTTKYRESKAGKGEKTVEQILSAGLEAFAQYGQEGITTRQLSKIAGVNIAAIAYYFGGKNEYYLEVVKYLLQERINTVLDYYAHILDELNKSERSPQIAVAIFCKLLRTYAYQILMNPNARFMASISSREHLQPTAAFDILYEKAMLPIHTAFSELIACATGIPADSPDTIIRAHAIIGQALNFRLTATTICRRLNWDEISKERAEHIAGIITEMACRSIGIEPVPEKKNK